jgi:hypothetical protein
MQRLERLVGEQQRLVGEQQKRIAQLERRNVAATPAE